MSKNHTVSRAVPPGYVLPVDHLALRAIEKVADHASVHAPAVRALGREPLARLGDPNFRVNTFGPPFAKETEVIGAAYYGALLLPESLGSWRAAVKNIARLILNGELSAEELPGGASISSKDGRIALQESAAREYGFGGREEMEWAIDQMDAFAKLQGLPSFETLRHTRQYIDCLRSKGHASMKLLSEEEVVVLETGPAYLVDFVARSREEEVPDVAYQAHGEWLLTASVADGAVRATALYPPELLVVGFGHYKSTDPKAMPADTIEAILDLIHARFPGLPFEVGALTLDPPVVDVSESSVVGEA